MNVDFADVRAVMLGAGTSLMGEGRGVGTFLIFAIAKETEAILVFYPW